MIVSPESPQEGGPLPSRTVLVGRAPELFEIERALHEVADKGTCRTVTIVGAPGVGKSRLSVEFLARVQTLDGIHARIVRARAVPGEGSLQLFANILRARFGLAPSMSEEQARDRVRDQVVDVIGDRKVGDVLFYLGQIMGLRYPDSPVVQAVAGDPLQDEQLRTAILRRFIEADAASCGEPLIFALDDLHNAHKTSLDLLAYLIERVRAQVLFVCGARPEVRVVHEGWAEVGGPRHTTVELGPLSELSSAAVMSALLPPRLDSAMLEELIDQACFIAGGNPARLERVAQLFFETGVVAADASRGYQIYPERLVGAKLPLSVEEAVYARMAVLSVKERELLEHAATMGGVFWLGGLIAIRRAETTPQPPLEQWLVPRESAADIVEIQGLLQGLMDRDYILRVPDGMFAGDQEFVFKHNLERESVERLTPKGRARRYHRAVADWLSLKEGMRGTEEMLLAIAHHRERAGTPLLAAPLFIEAGEKARLRYAHAVALQHYGRGLELLRTSTPDEALYLDALHHYGDVAQALGKTVEALASFREMLQRALRHGCRQKAGAALSRIGRLQRESGELDLAFKHLELSLRMFEEEQDDRGIAAAFDDLGKVFWLRGVYPKAFEYTERALAMRKALGDKRSIAVSLNNLGLVQQDSGLYKEAMASFEQALAIRTEIGDRVGIAMTLNNLGTIAQDQRDDRRALALFEKAFAAAKAGGDKHRIALVLTNLGETHYRIGEPARAVVLLKEAAAIADEIGDKLVLAEVTRGLAKAYLGLHEHVKARECAAQAVALVQESGSEVQLGIALRSLGEVIASGTAGEEGVKEAAREIKRSMEIFERIGNDVELARSARAYADVLRGLPEAMRDRELDEDVEAQTRRADEISVRILAARPVELSS